MNRGEDGQVLIVAQLHVEEAGKAACELVSEAPKAILDAEVERLR